MKLYVHPLSGHSHRARLFLSLIGIAGAHPTLADIALYSYTSSAPEGNVDLAGYPRITQWLALIEALPGFVPFKKTAIGLSAGV